MIGTSALIAALVATGLVWLALWGIWRFLIWVDDGERAYRNRNRRGRGPRV